MEIKISFLLIFLSASIFTISDSAKLRDRNTKPYRVVCYYGAWTAWRVNDGKYEPENINAHSCTHIVYAFAALNDNRIVAFDVIKDLDAGFYRRFNQIRLQNPQLTTLIALGGWNEGNFTQNFKYSKMVEDPVKRKIFVNSVVEFLKEHDFDGLDFDWEYPGLRENISRPQDKKNFVLVLKELREAFEPYGFMLTAAVAAGKKTIEAGYDIPQVDKYLDMINVMAYDLHGAWDNYTGHSSGLYPRSDESDEDKYLNADYAINHWIKGGADRKKLILGIPMYGKCHTLKDTTKTGYGAPSAGPGIEGEYTQERGTLAYHELCLKDKQERWISKWNDCHLAPYMFRGDQWCSYDDEISVKYKAEYVKAMGLGGAMIWSFDNDDFHGRCSGKKNPLITAIVEVMEDTRKPELPIPALHCKSQITPPTTTHGPISSTTPTTTTIRTSWNGEYSSLCKSVGNAAIPGECYKFVKCAANGLEYNAAVIDCPPGTAYQEALKICDHTYNVPGC